MAKQTAKIAPKKKPAKKSNASSTKKTSKIAATRSPRKALIADKPRKLRLPKHNSIRPSKRISHPVKLSSSWKLSVTTAKLLWENRKLFIGISLVYALLNLILVQSLASSSDINSLKNSLDKTFSGHLGSAGSSVGVFTLIAGSSNSGSNQTSSAYQVFLALIASLAVIWALRQTYAGTRIRIRDAYYKGMAPLIPFILVLLIISLQLLPLLIGSSIFSLVMSNGIALHAIEKILWTVFFILMAAATLYMLSSSIFAIYIVTLTDMTPVKAVRSASQLVRIRRLSVLRKIICLPLILLVIAAIIMIPIIIWLTPLSQWVFFVLTIMGLVAAHTYMYTLYRELLNE